VPGAGHPATAGLEEIRRLAVKHWTAELTGRYASSTVSGIITLLSLVLTAAVEERMIAHNPIQGLRLTRTPKRPRTGAQVPPSPRRSHDHDQLFIGGAGEWL
jgi:hypothetical protein